MLSPTLSTHVLNTAKGGGANSLKFVLYRLENKEWTPVYSGCTDAQGRDSGLKQVKVTIATYKIRFETEEYFTLRKQECFYPFVDIVFRVTAPEHYHVPLLLSPYGYSTYRGC